MILVGIWSFFLLSNGDDAPAPEPYLPPERPSARDPSSVCGQRPCSGMVVYDPLMQVKKKRENSATALLYDPLISLFID